MKTKTLKMIGYKIKGVSIIEMWGGDIGEITFTDFSLMRQELDMKEVTMAIDDGGFGCQAIIGATIDVYELYEGGYEELLYCDEEIDREDFQNYGMNSGYIKEKYGATYSTELDWIVE